MNYYGSKDLADSFRTVRKNTIVIAEDIPEAQYGYRAAPETRSVAELLVHIAVAPSLQERIQGTEKRTTLEGFDFIHLVPEGDRVFATYEAHAAGGRRFRNTEILTLRDGQVVEVEVYFGWSIPHQAKPGGFVSG